MTETKEAGETGRKEGEIEMHNGKLDECPMFGMTYELAGGEQGMRGDTDTVEALCLKMAYTGSELMTAINRHFTPDQIKDIGQAWENMTRACNRLDGALADVITDQRERDQEAGPAPETRTGPMGAEKKALDEVSREQAEARVALERHMREDFGYGADEDHRSPVPRPLAKAKATALAELSRRADERERDQSATKPEPKARPSSGPGR